MVRAVAVPPHDRVADERERAAGREDLAGHRDLTHLTVADGGRDRDRCDHDTCGDGEERAAHRETR